MEFLYAFFTHVYFCFCLATYTFVRYVRIELPLRYATGAKALGHRALYTMLFNLSVPEHQQGYHNFYHCPLPFVYLNSLFASFSFSISSKTLSICLRKNSMLTLFSAIDSICLFSLSVDL